ncbi:MAG: tRNA (adenosine(37)-N6)-dimethylallyltransferase MiaA [Gammaproteobacteria bacterium]|nr:tRNA (adenosine(37)-N6)-dimethylallyltransferase MiaA [Gammaproteobacteria bacterium]
MTQLPLAICLFGPTASGKTACAIALREVLPVEIVSVDSSQVYRGMDIGTAKPTADEQARAPHRLIDIRDPAESYSAADFCDDARREMRAITAAGKIPLLVGGTMFYFRALEYGLSELPPATPEVRRQLHEDATRLGWPAMHARLAMIDPVRANQLKPNDAQRIQRALEIHAVTGRRSSELVGTTHGAGSEFRFYKIGLWPSERAVLHERIAARFEKMLERGLISEVELLYRRGDLDLTQPSMRTVGYRQIWNYLTGLVDYNEMVEQAIAATRQLAKRQLTWLRSYTDVQRVDCSGDLPTRAVVEIAQRVSSRQGSQI